MPLPESESEAAGGEGAPPPAPWQPPCAQVVQEVGPQAVEQRLRRIAQGRLRAKVARLRGRLAASASVEEGVYQLLLEALGAGGNSAAMVALARRLPLARLPSGAGAATLRPANRPERRLAAAAALVVHLRARGGLAAGLRRWRSGGTQALLELERWYCRYGACALCPLAALSNRPRRRAALGSPNIREGGSPAASAARA